MRLAWSKRAWSACFLIAAILALTAGLAAASPVSWGKATEAKGTGALNDGGNAGVTAVSCGDTGACASVGHYSDANAVTHAFVQSETGGVWDYAIPVPGIDPQAASEALGVSCGSPTECTAGGDYTGADEFTQPFVAVEKNGNWDAAITIQLADGSDFVNPVVTAISCPSAGFCAAGGNYTDGSGMQQAFVVDEKNGTWGQAIPVPNITIVNFAGAAVNTITCAVAGNCAVGGYFVDQRAVTQAFVANERAGVWRAVLKVPGVSGLDVGRDSQTTSVSCGSGNNCSAGGYYTDKNGTEQPFVAVEKRGYWNYAVRVLGISTLNKTGSSITSLSCTGAAVCSGGGYYIAGGQMQAFVVSERKYRWGTAQQLAIDNASHVQLESVSCSSPGECAAAGFYTGANGTQTFVAAQATSKWGTPEIVLGSGALNAGQMAHANSVSCADAGGCAIGGWYTDGSGSRQAFVTKP